jgi:hypothetical protein
VNGSIISIFAVDAEKTETVGASPGSGVKHDSGDFEFAGELLLNAANV